MKIIFTGGGTGGHITPIIAIARQLRKIYKKQDLELFFIGPKDELGSLLLSQEYIKTKNILAGKIRNYLTLKSFFQNFIDLFFKIPIGFIQSFFLIFFLSPDLVFSKGGYGSIPGALAAKILFVPIFLHESDVAPGKANKFLEKSALKIFTSFPETEYFPLEKIICLGNPIRTELLNQSKEQAQEFFKITSQKPIILILGGSQGAQRINDKILEVLSFLLKDFEVIHQTGENNYQTIKNESEMIISKDFKKFYHLYSFLQENELAKAYFLADLVISRAGSSSIFEIAAMAKPCILIPLPESAQNHQVKNAYNYQEAGACLIIEENNFTSSFFLEKLKYLFDKENPGKLNQMKEKAQKFSKPNAARVIANYLIKYLTPNID